MQNLSANIGVHIKPVFQSKNIGQVLAPKEKKPPIVSNQCVVYKFQYHLCDALFIIFDHFFYLFFLCFPVSKILLIINHFIHSVDLIMTLKESRKIVFHIVAVFYS